MTQQRWRLWLSVCFLVLAGCVPISPTTHATGPASFFEVVHLASDIPAAEAYWRVEIRERYPTERVLMVVCHGTDYEGEWWVVPDVGNPMPTAELVEQLRTEYRESRIVLITCNPGGYELLASGVTYARDDVWVVPDAYISPLQNLGRDWWDDSIGDIDEFQENPWQE